MIENKIKLYNSLSKQVEDFKPFNPPKVGLYTCGFTVYDHTHIGHIKKYVGDDILRRVLAFNGYDVTHVQNVTDVGHLESDADTGEDKMEKGAKKRGLSVYDVAKEFEDEFFNAMDEVNVLRPTIIQRATDGKAIAKQIEFIQILLDKGFAYIRNHAIYFDVSKLPEYNPFSKQKLEDKLTIRGDVEVDPEKKHQADFVLWMFRKGKYENHSMHWDSPWGDGFPGWHIECSAIGISNLGEYIDIHTGGIDHLEVHHPDEIAQNYGITGHDVVKYWLHHNFLTVDGKKMSKSLGNFYTLKDVTDKGYHPMALRYFMLTANYRSQINFTWDALSGTQTAYDRLITHIQQLKENNDDSEKSTSESQIKEYINMFKDAVNDDLNTPEALAVLWKLIQDNNLNSKSKLDILSKFDQVLGLNLLNADVSKREINFDELDSRLKELIEKRAIARRNKNFEEADRIKEEIHKLGYRLEDKKDKTEIHRNL